MFDLKTIGELITILGVLITLVLIPVELVKAWKQGMASATDQKLTGGQRLWHPIKKVLATAYLFCTDVVPFWLTAYGVAYFFTPPEWHLTTILFVIMTIMFIQQSWSNRRAREKALLDAEDRVMKAEDRVIDTETAVLDAQIRVMEVEDRLMLVEDRVTEAEEKVREAQAAIEKRIMDFEAEMERRALDSMDED